MPRRPAIADQSFCELGLHAQIDEGVVLGYRYPGDSRPLCIGDYAIIRSGTVIYANTTIGQRFQCGHHVVIRAEVTIGDRCVVHHQCTLEGRIRIGDGVKIMAHVYLPSATVIGSMVFIGPGTTFLNDKYPLRHKSLNVKGPIIKDHVTIGGGVTIVGGVTVGENSFVGGGSVLVKDIPPDALAYGVPARCYPLPNHLKKGNLPEIMLPQTDLWGAQEDESWRQENYRGKEKWA